MHDPRPRLPALLEAVLSVGTDLELRATLQHIVDAAAELTEARYAALDMTDPGRDGLAEIRTARRPDLPDSAGLPKSPEPPEPPELAVPIQVDDEVFGDLCLAGKRDGPFTDEDEQLVRVLATHAGIAIGNARLYETARQRERWIEGAAAVTTALLSGESAADALMTVAERARRLAKAEAGIILRPTEDGGMEIVTASTLDDSDDILGTTIEPGSPVLDQLLGGEPVFIDDSATDPRMTTHVRHRFGPNMMLPLQEGGRLIGTLALPRRRGGRPYTAVERLLATQFASQAALALVHAAAQHSRERLAVYEDRDRIARDLHDLVVQRLFATGMMLESTQRTSAGAGEVDDDVHATLGRAVDELQSTIQEVRTAIFALQQPPSDAPTTFRGKVLRETAGAAAVLGFQPSTRFTGAVESRIAKPVAGRLLTALRRALTAASRRAGVSRVEITVDATATLPDGRPGVRLTVFDDGDTKGDLKDGESEGGDSEGGSGTTVTWQSPM
ncbi:GAF domain-containing protein [Streptomyces sp. NBC_01340]|uniref:sensor histidine kinase n=1 Tax=unclassified Streptomyces TaxID=2593676 RepID=UPI00225768BB|nr:MULTISPECIES: GAF domain-containing protein [unclassified Streptomyces]MCX4453896.1 GAF domain-containing protein [Streptomyces sp. NBC_01719]MCX4493256.1 GAF domain-containing protein [Streptomyces sp. NBC_01728]WSI38392.1 GAF domain-containing protein [Streptomyces sp. NBC_01340]